MSRSWTRLDEIEACTLRWLGYKNAAIARRLQRTTEATRHLLKRLMPTYERVHPRRGQLATKVRRLNRSGMYDAEIARRIGVSRSLVSLTRKRLGLPRRLSNADRARIASLSRDGRIDRLESGVIRCIGCDRISPRFNMIEGTGWACRPMPGYEQDKEYHCPKCFREHGWGEPVRATA